VASGAQRLIDETGDEGYLSQWITHPFPDVALTRLRTAIRSANV
jgi:hypothetical protein